MCFNFAQISAHVSPTFEDGSPSTRHLPPWLELLFEAYSSDDRRRLAALELLSVSTAHATVGAHRRLSMVRLAELVIRIVQHDEAGAGRFIATASICQQLVLGNSSLLTAELCGQHQGRSPSREGL